MLNDIWFDADRSDNWKWLLYCSDIACCRYVTLLLSGVRSVFCFNLLRHNLCDFNY